MNIFSPTFWQQGGQQPQQQPQQQTQNQQQNNGGQQQQQQQGGGQQQPQHQPDPNAIPAFQKPGGEGADKSPLDGFADLFNLNDEDKKRLDAQGQPDKLFTWDQGKLNESVKGMSFINPEQMTQHWNNALKGDSNALGELLNGVAREIYARSATLSATLSERASAATAQNFRSSLPQHLRDFSAEENLQSLSPAAQHPAAKPLVTALKSQFALKYPNASGKEISEMVNKYLESFVATIGPKPPTSSDSRQAPDNANWGEFFAQKSPFGQ